MQRKTPLWRRLSSERFAPHDGLEQDDLLSQVQSLSSSACLPSPPADGITLLVKGKPLTSVVQVLADVLLQQQVQSNRDRASAEAQARQTDALISDYLDAVGRIAEDLHLSHRPFLLSGVPLSFSRGGQQPKGSLRRTSADTLAEAVQRTHEQLQQLRYVVLSASADSLARKIREKHLSDYFFLWAVRGIRRVQSRELEAAANRNLLATYYARWRRRAVSDWRQLQLRRGRHLRAVQRKSRKAILSVYLRKWEAFVEAPSTQTAQLRIYQRRVAHVWSVSGPVVTTWRREFFERWKRWTAAQSSEQEAAAAFAELEVRQVKIPQLHLLQRSFAKWQEKTQQRQLSRLHHRLSRVMAAQSSQVLLRHHFRQWVSCAAHARRLRRLEVLAADQHKCRVTALARRYFNELRFFRREQQYQRMMRSVEASLLTLADRLNVVENAVLGQSKQPSVVAIQPNDLFVSPPRSLHSIHGERNTPRVQWSPASDEELRARVEELLSRSR
ncbi:hypothetical protein ABB37_00467 [Leptomonas pyrrhocoris]|uniref:Sfi1 spindle body domain-containing protein n=1 Tax=Leptomonas pyrrhocoris TaxID=157538 RepID=A0A0N0E0A9_LEPPY|nr:hypothetical protein ABB37_00467 [Leptomonas pyrrhocoris]KPA86232.1 hypothetical protein ABB37_00467 [Leptomonas pyrrhocoris]|eukprot:XP_015664671.1 hypothetical protein ABB37_00467 [Leptomonas pyrrhocoris]